MKSEHWGIRPTAHAGPYTAQAPNKTPEQVKAEAILAFAMAAEGYSNVDIARKMDLSLRTVCRRLQQLTLALRGRNSDVLRMIEYTRLEELHSLLRDRTKIEDAETAPTHVELARLTGEMRLLSTARASLLGLSKGGEDDTPDLTEDSGEWIDGDERDDDGLFTDQEEELELPHE